MKQLVMIIFALLCMSTTTMADENRETIKCCHETHATASKTMPDYSIVCDGNHEYGTKKCTNCNGRGNVVCNRCSGSGRVTCAGCSGKGYTQNVGTGQRRCSSCQGKGTQRCGTCSGKGTKTCGSCRGSGQIYVKDN